MIAPSSFLHDKTGRCNRLYSVSYVSKTESAPSARDCCAGLMVESSKTNRTKSIGRWETLSTVILMGDLITVSKWIKPRYVESLPLSFVKHHSAVSNRCTSNS